MASVSKKVIFSLGLLMAVHQACYVKTHAHDNDHDGDYWWDKHKNDDSFTVDTTDQEGRACTTFRTGRYTSPHTYCYENKKEEKIWETNCQASSCAGLPVYVYYMLTEDLGTANVVLLEAFDNPRFAGAPIASSRMGSFNASKPGQYQKADLYLKPGEYYIRAFIANDDQMVLPYQYQNLNLVSDKPVGVVGALSGIQTVVVKSRSQQPNPNPVSVYIDQLFKTPQSEVPSNADMRIRFNIENPETIQLGRKLIVELHKDIDLTVKPIENFEMATERLMVEGRKGKAELIATDVPLGSFTVFAFIDNNGNGFYDVDEPARFFMKADEPSLVKLEANRIVTLDMNLSVIQPTN